jgi:hypothetical protein
MGVERSETHHPFQHDNVAEAMGFTSFYPSYALRRTYKTCASYRNCGNETGGFCAAIQSV